MSITALPYVNWIFWAALGSGTLFVVGTTRGTTRGYRVFTAALLAVVAALLLVSDLFLPAQGVAVNTADVRRPLVIAFCALVAAYLAASIVAPERHAARLVLAVIGALAGIVALVSLAASSGTRSGGLFAGQLVLSALALGAVHAAMLLGHWYLVTPKLSPAPLRRMMWLLIAALSVQLLAVAIALIVVSAGPLTGGLAPLTWLRVGVGLLLPLGVTVLALLASRAASLQATTGLLYIGLALVAAGSIAGSSLTYLTGVPV
jgi:hypothetical protein